MNDKNLLMQVMKIISDVKDVEPKTEGIIRRIREMVNVLKQHGYIS
jgi:dynein heavy chain